MQQDSRAIGDLDGFPTEIIDRMLNEQEHQGNPRDVTVFQKDRTANVDAGGFLWFPTRDGYDFWVAVIGVKRFDMFFEVYPVQ